MSKSKNLLFSFIALVLIPVLFFTAIELCLIIFGVGTQYNVFNTVEIDGKDYYQDNRQFANQFYPEQLKIGLVPATFSAERSDNLVRVFVLGGSAAMGFPHKNHGVDRFITAQLQAQFPDKKIEVINTGMTSINSYVVYEVARTLPDNSADFAVILLGNNEVIGPHGPATFSKNFSSSLTVIRTLQALKRTRTWQGLSSLVASAQEFDAKEDLKWQGMQMFTQNSIPYNDSRLDDVYQNYRQNLTDIIEILNDKGMHVVLSTVPVNLRHSAPFKSEHKQGITDQQLDSWKTFHSSGLKQIADGNLAQAKSDFESALAIDPDYADTHFQLATVNEKLSRFDVAKQHYVEALNKDALRFRTDTKLNNIIRDIAQNSPANLLSFVDSAALFERTSQPYQPGWKLLLEHVHYSFEGNHLLADAFSRVIAERLAPQKSFKSLSATEMAKRIGFPNHETIEVMNVLQDMVKKPPFTGQSNHAELLNFVTYKINLTTREVGSPRDVIQRRQPDVQRDVLDWKVHFELAALYEFTGDTKSAYKHLTKVVELYPHNQETYLKISKLKSAERDWTVVVPALETALQYTRENREQTAELLGWLGQAYFETKQNEKAAAVLQQVIENHSDSIGLTLRAYGTLIKYSVAAGYLKEVQQYANDLQKYGNRLVKQGKVEEFPMLYNRMAQVLSMAGYRIEAEKWAAMGKQK